MDNMGWSMQNSFLTLLNRTKIVASQKLAIDVQKNILYKLRKIYGTRAIYDGGVKEAPFWVLVGAQMPSILIEVGYITHPIEGRRIYSNKYQLNMATAIANGIDAYFLKN
jgi:N-acetylmuramoyl-L-alanine amidase